MSTAGPISLTLSEASYVVGRPSTAINKAVDRGVIRAKLHKRGKGVLRKIGPAELRFLKVSSDLEKDFTPRGRRKLYEAMRRLPLTTHRVEVGRLALDLRDIDRQIAERLRQLAELKALVEPGSASEPLIRGTTAPVYVIAALARGQTTAEIQEDYPGLTAAQVEAAAAYAQAYPKAGRPLPERSFWRALEGASAAGVFDVETGDEPIEPQLMP